LTRIGTINLLTVHAKGADPLHPIRTGALKIDSSQPVERLCHQTSFSKLTSFETSRRQFIVGTCAVVAASSVSGLAAEPEIAVLALGDTQ